MSHQEREKLKLLQRVRKLRGQLDAVERSLAADEECGGDIRAQRSVRQRQVGRVRMRPIGHANFVARQHGRGYAFPEREIADLLVAAYGLTGDLRGALRLGLRHIHLQIVLGEIVWIGRPAVHEPDDPRNLADLLQLGRGQNVFDEKEHEGPEWSRNKRPRMRATSSVRAVDDTTHNTLYSMATSRP